jgi:hypothetical protein
MGQTRSALKETGAIHILPMKSRLIAEFIEESPSE